MPDLSTITFASFLGETCPRDFDNSFSFKKLNIWQFSWARSCHRMLLGGCERSFSCSRSPRQWASACFVLLRITESQIGDSAPIKLTGLKLIRLDMTLRGGPRPFVILVASQGQASAFGPGKLPNLAAVFHCSRKRLRAGNVIEDGNLLCRKDVVLHVRVFLIPRSPVLASYRPPSFSPKRQLQVGGCADAPMSTHCPAVRLLDFVHLCAAQPYLIASGRGSPSPVFPILNRRFGSTLR